MMRSAEMAGVSRAGAWAVALTLLLLGTVAFVSMPARADDDHHDRGRDRHVVVRHDRDWRERHAHVPPPVVYEPPPVAYAPPPVVYQPPAGINVVIPLRF